MDSCKLCRQPVDRLCACEKCGDFYCQACLYSSHEPACASLRDVEDRDYQIRTMNAVRRAIGNGKRRILLVSPTGSGKGYVAARIMQQAASKGNSSVFFADQRELVTQLGSQLSRLSVPYRILLAGHTQEFASYDEDSAAISWVASKDTFVSRAIRRKTIEVPGGKIVLFDEAHKSLAETWKMTMGQYPDSIVIGFTATPCRTDGRGLGDMYDELIVAATYKELISAGHLVPMRIWSPHRPDLKGLKVSKGDFSAKGLEERMNVDSLVGNVVRDWIARAGGRSTVCFASGIQHSIHLRNEFLQHGIRAEHLDGGTPDQEREDILGRVKDGITTVLCNYGVATTGVDVPRWKYMINARPTKSFGLWRQMAGRIARPYPGHDHAVIQDHSTCAEEFGFPDEDVEWSLDTSEKQHERHAAKKRERGEKEPYKCHKCDTMYRGPKCPKCGYVPERRGEDVQMAKGQLREMERKKANRRDSLADKQKFLESLIGQAVGGGRTMAYVSVLYKKKYGVWPNRNSGLKYAPAAAHGKMSAREFYRKYVAPNKVRA